MRYLVIALVLFGVVDRALGQERPVTPAEAHGTKIEHLLKAAEHLEAAGLTEDAHKIRQRANQEGTVATVGILEPPHPVASATSSPLADQTPVVLLKLRVLEFSRTKLRSLGYKIPELASGEPWSIVEALSKDKDSSKTATAIMLNSVNGTTLGALVPNDRFFATLEGLRNDKVAKVLSEPTLVTQSNHAAHFHSGGLAPVAVPLGDGKMGTEYKEYGTQVDLFPVVRADQTIRLECRVELSELDMDNCVTVAGTTVPGRRIRQIDTAADLRPGQTLVIGGLPEYRRLSSAPAVEEVETLVLLTPEIADPMLSDNAAITPIRR
jgi:pilus assembly protein CpaC